MVLALHQDAGGDEDDCEGAEVDGFGEVGEDEQDGAGAQEGEFDCCVLGVLVVVFLLEDLDSVPELAELPVVALLEGVEVADEGVELLAVAGELVGEEEVVLRVDGLLADEDLGRVAEEGPVDLVAPDLGLLLGGPAKEELLGLALDVEDVVAVFQLVDGRHEGVPELDQSSGDLVELAFEVHQGLAVQHDVPLVPVVVDGAVAALVDQPGLLPQDGLAAGGD